MEWCHDRFSEKSYDYDMKNIVIDSLVSERVSRDERHVRGGGFRSIPIGNRSCGRSWFVAWGKKSDIGFRPVRTRR